MTELSSVSSCASSALSVFSELPELKLDKFTSSVELCKVVQLPKLSAADMNYLQGQLTVLYPEVSWLEPNTTAYIVTQNLFEDLLEIGVTSQELRIAFKYFKQMKTYGNAFRYQDFMQCVNESRYKLYSYDELEKLKSKEPMKYRENLSRYYPKAKELLTKEPVEMYGISGLPLPVANNYNTIYKVRSKKNFIWYEVVGVDGLTEYEALMTTRNYSGFWRKPTRYFAKTAEDVFTDNEELAKNNEWYRKYLKERQEEVKNFQQTAFL